MSSGPPTSRNKDRNPLFSLHTQHNIILPTINTLSSHTPNTRYVYLLLGLFVQHFEYFLKKYIHKWYIKILQAPHSPLEAMNPTTMDTILITLSIGPQLREGHHMDPKDPLICPLTNHIRTQHINTIWTISTMQPLAHNNRIPTETPEIIQITRMWSFPQ